MSEFQTTPHELDIQATGEPATLVELHGDPTSIALILEAIGVQRSIVVHTLPQQCGSECQQLSLVVLGEFTKDDFGAIAESVEKQQSAPLN
jgi:hypothetical protein